MAVIVEGSNDAAGSRATTYSMTRWDEVQGRISGAGDDDWIRITPLAGRVIEVTVTTNLPASSGTAPELGVELFVDTLSDARTMGSTVMSQGAGGTFELVMIDYDHMPGLIGSYPDGDLFLSINPAFSSSAFDYTISYSLLGRVITPGAYDGTLRGTSQSDFMSTGSGAQVIYAYGGDDQILLGGGPEGDTVYSGHGNDDITAGEADNRIVSGPGDDIITDATGASYLHGGSGNDQIHDGGGDDTVYAAGGDDRLFIGEGSNRIHGGAGNDTFRGGLGVDDSFLSGGYGDDEIYVEVGEVTMVGGPGNDTLQSVYGPLLAYGGADNDVLIGSHASERLGGVGDTLNGGTGNDDFIVTVGDDTMNGGDGYDVAWFNYYVGILRDTAIVLDYGFETRIILGREGEYDIRLTYHLRSIEAIVDQNDELWAVSALHSDTRFDGVVNAGYFDGDSTVTDGAGDDFLIGHRGNDELIAGLGNDQLRAGDGADVLYGNLGDDTLHGGMGRDTLYGGTGSDHFVLENLDHSALGGTERDVIADFEQGSDVIDLSWIDADPGIKGDQGFAFLGEDAAFPATGGVMFTRLQGRDITVIKIDLDGDGMTDAQIELTGLHTLTEDDFLL